MGRLVNVVLPSGRVVAVDEEVAKVSQLSRDTVEQEAAGVTSGLNAERSSGVGEGVKAGLEGAADTASFGLYGAARGALDPEGARNMRIRGEERSGSRLLGEAATMALPGAGLGRLSGAPGLAREVGGVVGGKAGQFVEGSVLGVGSYISETNITGDQLTIEALAINAGIGGVIDVGMHVAANKLEGMSWAKKTRDAKARILAEDVEGAKKGAGIFGEPPPSWNEFVELHEARKKSIKSYNLEVEKEAKAYKAAVAPAGLNQTIREFDKARSTVLAEVNRDPVVREAISQSDTARRAFETTQRDYDKLLTNDEAFTARLNQLQKVLADKGGEYAPEGVSGLYNKKTAGYEGKVVGERFIPKKKGTYLTGTPKQPISPELKAELKDYNRRLSEIYKKKAGGWRAEGGKWIEDSTVPVDMEGALSDAAQLRADMAQHFGGKKIARIPFKPEAPVEPEVLASGRTAEMIQASREIAKGVEDARTLMREGRYEDASLVLSDLKARVGTKAKDLTLPDMPLAPRALQPELRGSLPKSIEEFTRKHADQVNEIAQQLDPTSQQALLRVMKDLDVKVSGDPIVDLTAMHKTLGDYRRKMAEVKAAAEKAAADEAKKPMILKLINRAARLAGGRAVDVGGALGGVTRTLGGEAMARGMAGVESATLGTAMMESRSSVRTRVRDMVAKYGVPTAGALRHLAAPTAYLKKSFPGGQEDPETDPRKLAVNRIHELQSAAMAAPDAAFLALQGMLDHPSDVAWKMHQHVVGSLNYLTSTLPRDPGTDTMMFKSNWTPQYHEAIALAHRLEAAQDPLTAIARAIAGDSHPAATETLWAIYPSVMNELAHELSVAAPNLKNLTYEQASAYSNLFRTPLTGLQQPVVVTTIQGLYMNGAQASAPPPGRPTGGAPRQAPGRPAAVQSPVAGSNVASLTGS